MSLGVVWLLAVAFTAKGSIGSGAPVLVFLMLFGWLSGLGLTQLYKIVPFLSWLARYGSRLGHGPVPRVQDLVDEGRASHWFVLYFLGTAVAAVAAAVGLVLLYRVGLGLTLLATLELTVEYWRAWRADYAAAVASPPHPITALSVKEGTRRHEPH